MNPVELASILEMMAQTLRLLPAGAVPGGAMPAPAVPGRTLGDWLDIHVPQVLGKGYKAQTIRNRTANMNHARRPSKEP